MTIEDFVQHLKTEALDYGVKNVLAKPAKESAIDEWQADRPDFPLPALYRQLLLAANGIKIHSTRHSSAGFLHIVPLSKVRSLAEQVMKHAGLEEEDLTHPPSCLMVGENQDAQWCLGLDTANGHFLEVLYSGGTTDLGTMPAFLDWVVERLKQLK